MIEYHAVSMDDLHSVVEQVNAFATGPEGWRLLGPIQVARSSGPKQYVATMVGGDEDERD